MKNKALFLSLVVLLVAMFSVTAWAEAPELLTYAAEGVPPVDITLGNQLPVTGYYAQTVELESGNRTVKVYIPEGTPIRAYFTVIAVPDGVDTGEFLDESGWFALADMRREGLFILEPAASGWGSATAELPYVEAALTLMNAKEFYAIFGMHYLVGYGQGGSALEAWAANYPLHTISAVYLDSPGLDSAYLQEVGAQEFGAENATYDNVAYRDIPIPIWYIHEDLTQVADSLDYWLKANDSVERPVVNPALLRGSAVYAQSAASDKLITGYSEVRSQVATLEDTVEYTDPALTLDIYNFLSYYTRYDNTSVYGNVLGVRADFTALGVDINTITLEDGYGQTWNREYLVHVPANAAEKFPQGAPVVYIAHGGSQTGRLFFDATHWWEVSEEYGFIGVYLHGSYSNSLSPTWNTTPTNPSRELMNDLEYLEAVIAAVDADYRTDTNRRYITGQSMGCLFSQAAGFYLPQYFTAIGATAAIAAIDDLDNYDDSVVPVYLILGEHDIDDYHLDNEEGKLRPAVSYWLERNGLADIDSWTAVGSSGRQTTYNWADENGVPLFRYSWTAARQHNCIVDEMWLLWESWFQYWDRDEEGERVYTGPLVSAAVTLPADLEGFRDVAEGSWYYEYVMSLAAAGVVNGYEDGTFRPTGTVTLGEALALLLRAAGYDELAATGSHWASGYLTQALADGIVAGELDLTAAATRLEVAEIAAKALDLTAENASPFTDTDSAAAAALFEAGIIEGYEDGSFGAAGTLSRAEISAILFRI